MTEPQHSEPSPPEVEAERPAVQWPEVPVPTGDPLVDRALSLLDGVVGSPVPDHGELYTGVHDGLLEALDAEPGLPAPPQSSPRPEGDS
ncbi:hypothetical protein ACIQH5_12190 [Paenarthrobacter sp. NPDC091711]|uniref:hypothetical protein n=1 Tax=Paenarthrobacter sp. NPDC091711 TaxID=3364385 RepID=UPI0038276B4F